MIAVHELGKQAVYYFDAATPYEALSKMQYYLDANKKDKNAKIHKTDSNMHLYLDHSGTTYAVRL